MQSSRLLGAVFCALALAAAPGVAGAAEEARPSHGIAMHGDLKYPPDFKHFDYVNPDAPKGGAVRLQAIGTYDSFNPFIVKGSPAAGIGRIYETLMSGSADEPFSEYGLLAESITVPEDRSWVEFRLRPEARWHDGKPVTADDVVWTFETLITKAVPFFRGYYGDVKQVEKRDARTVRFTFKSGTNRELPLILGQLIVLPKHYWAERDFTKTTLEPPLGSGSYKVGAFEPGRHVEYERVEDYWGRNLPVNVGRDNFDRIRYDYYRDGTVSVEAFKAGEYDFRSENSSKNWATAYDFPALKQGLVKKEEIPHDRSTGMQAFVFNTRRPLFQDRKVRQALAYAFDFEWSNQALFYGQYARSRSYFDNSELAATGLPGAEELAVLEPYRGRVPAEVFTQAYAPPATDGSGRIRANLGRAAKLLREAGWSFDKAVRKLTHKASGRTMDFEILLVSPLFERIVLPFAKNLERLGVAATVRTVDSAQYRRRLDDFDFDVVIGTWGQSLSPGNEQRNYWGSDFAGRPGSRNLIGIKDPVVDALVEGVVNAPDRKSLVAHVRALDRVLQWGHWVIPQWHIPYDRLVYWDRFGRPEVTPTQGVQFDAWWIDPRKEAELEAKRSGS
ncbi:MAG: extracellular solute-binding protein [Deltaproteobacteria bacterium]|nr:extracellular solute-binding protein [Deltaproteobacteria bacterium]